MSRFTFVNWHKLEKNADAALKSRWKWRVYNVGFDCECCGIGRTRITALASLLNEHRHCVAAARRDGEQA